jgi:hypothetical protein
LDQKSILAGNFVLVFSGLFPLRIECVVQEKYLVVIVIGVQWHETNVNLVPLINLCGQYFSSLKFEAIKRTDADP